MGRYGAEGDGGSPGPVIEILEGDGRLYAAITPPGRPSSQTFELIHIGQNRFGLGRTVDGVLVEYDPDSTTLEFLSLDSEEGFASLQLPGPRLFSRVAAASRSER